MQVKQEGKSGIAATVIKEVLDKKGEQLKRETVSFDYYPPIYRVEVRGLRHDLESTDKNEVGEETPLDEEIDDNNTPDEESPSSEENENDTSNQKNSEDLNNDTDDSIEDSQMIEK